MDREADLPQLLANQLPARVAQQPLDALPLSGVVFDQEQLALNEMNREDVRFFADTVDTIGPMGRTVTDVARLLSTQAGYDPREAPRVFALLKDDHGDGSKLENFFFGNHPRLDDRIANTQELLKTKYAKVDTADLVQNTDEFAMRTRTVVRENAALDIRAGRFGLVVLDPPPFTRRKDTVGAAARVHTPAPPRPAPVHATAARMWRTYARKAATSVFNDSYPAW